MTNRIATTPSKLIPQITEAIPGVVTYGADLGMPADMETTMTAKKAALVTLDNSYEQARLALKTKVKARRTAIKNARDHIRVVRELLKPSLTPTYSQVWDALGFSGNLRIPFVFERLVSILTKTGSHLGSNPALGVADPNLAAAKTAGVETALVTVNTAVNVAKGDVQRLQEDRQAAADEVRQLLREVYSTLRVKLDPFDSRWIEFGFNKPGARQTPPAPVDVTVTSIGGNALRVKWPTVPRAEHYRLWLRVVGVDTELKSSGTTTELDFLFEQVPANAQVEVALSAVNESGESVKSAVVTVLTQ